MPSALSRQPVPPSALAELVGWWVSELGEWIGRRRVKENSEPPFVSADITLTRQGVLLGPDKAGPFPLAELGERSTEMFGSKGLPRSVVVALDETRFLKRRLTDHRIPLVRAQKMAELDVQTQTPFKPDDVYFLFSDGCGGQGSHYYIVRRDMLDPLLNELHAGRRRLAVLGFNDGDVVTWARPSTVAALEGRRGSLISGIRENVLWLAAAALLTLTSYNVSTAIASATTSVDRAIEEAEPKVKVARQAFKERTDRLKRIERLRMERDAYVPMVKVLEELSFIIPDTTYLTNISVRQGKVKITGFSKNAAELITLVDGSKVFVNPRFVSAVVKVLDRNGEQFDLEAEVQHAG